MAVQLCWSEPVRLDQFSGDRVQESRAPGLYVWIWQRGKGPRRIYYVGQSAGIYERQLEHVSMMLGGQYWTFNPSSDDFYESWRRCYPDIEHERPEPSAEYQRPRATDGIPERIQRASWAIQNIQSTFVSWAVVATEEPLAKEAKAVRRQLEALVNQRVRNVMVSYGIELAPHSRHIVPGFADTVAAKINIVHSGCPQVVELLNG